MTLYIKYMVTRRCKMIVQTILDQLGLPKCEVNLGKVELKEAITAEQHDQLKIALLQSGLELMDDKKAQLIEQVKNVIHDMLEADQLPKIKNSEYISEKLNYDYTYLANLFSQVTGTTIEHYIISQRIEQVKELLVYDELSLSQIAHQLNYSSVAHLSNQFKKVTGLTPTFFKQLKGQYRQIQPDEELLFDQLSQSFGWSLSSQQRQQYHQLLRSGSILLLTNPKKTILWTSRSFSTLTGYQPIDVLGKTPTFLQGPGTDPLTIRLIRKQLDQAKVVEVELVNYQESGQEYLCHLQIEPLRDDQGKLMHFLAVEYEVKN